MKIRNRKSNLKVKLELIILLAILAVAMSPIASTAPISPNIELDDIPTQANYTIKTNTTYYWSIAFNGHIAYEGTSASTVIQSSINALPSSGGYIFITSGIYYLTVGLTLTGPNQVPPTNAKTYRFEGAGMWNTELRATAAMDLLSVTACASVRISDMYLNQNNQNGHALRGVAGTGAADRSFMRSQVDNIEIRGVNNGYYGIYATNAYFINTWSRIYIRTSGGGIYFESTTTGYGNQHFENIFISMTGTYDTAVYLRNNGAPYGESTFDRIHIDGGDSSGDTYNLGVDLDGSNYNHFAYLKIENIANAVRMGRTSSTHGNVISSGYIIVNEADAKAFNLGSFASQNDIHDIWVSAEAGINAVLIYDNNTNTDRPNSYTNIQGYSTGFLGVGSYIVRVDSDASRLYGQMLWRKAQNTVVSANFRINATNTPNGQNMTITHALAMTPESYHFTIEETAGYSVYDWDAHVIEVFDVTSTSVTIRLVVTDASATNPSYAHVVGYFDVNG